MRRIAVCLSLVLAAAIFVGCTEPADPVVGEFAIEGVLTTDYKPIGCDPPYPTPYCRDTVAINEAVVGTLVIPNERSESDPNRYEGVTIAIGNASYPYGSATFEHGYLWAGAAPTASSIPKVTLEGTLAADSITGTIGVGYGFSAGTFGARVGTFVARRK